MSKKLFIPQKIKIGFQKRDNTLNGNLAYVIYFDENGKLRKEASWQKWRDNKIEPIEIENKPQDGYIVNKGITHFAYSSFGSDRFRVRIYSPLDFEFEIYPENFMAIVAISDISKQYINQECVFAWDEQELVLLPTNSAQYLEAVEHTESILKKKEMLKNQKSKAKIDGTSIYEFGNIFESKSGVYMYYGYADVLTESKIRNLREKDIVFDENGVFSANVEPEKKHLCFLVGSDINGFISPDNLYARSLKNAFMLLPSNAVFMEKTIHEVNEIWKAASMKAYYNKLIESRGKQNIYSSKDNWQIKKIEMYDSNRPTNSIYQIMDKWTTTNKEQSIKFIYSGFYMYGIEISDADKKGNATMTLFQIKKDGKKFINSLIVKKDELVYSHSQKEKLKELCDKHLNISKIINLELKDFEGNLKAVKIKM